MSPSNKSLTKNTSGAKVVTPVKKAQSPMAMVSPYNNCSKVKSTVLEKKKKVHNIIPLQYSDETPFGWAFEHFYDAKEFLKSLCKNDTTYLGGEEFKPFSNLSVHWVKNSALGVNLWIIHIDAETNADEKPFPIQCHVLFANKIARALLQHVLWPKEPVKVHKSIILNSSTESELMTIMDSNNRDNTEFTVSDSILPGKSELESLI